MLHQKRLIAGRCDFRNENYILSVHRLLIFGGKIENDLCAAGFYDYLDQGAVVAAEWSENFADLLALENPIRVNIERLDDTTRKITIEGVTV